MLSMVKPSSILLGIGTIILIFEIAISVTGLTPLAVFDTTIGPVSVRAEGITSDQAVILAGGTVFLAIGAWLKIKKN